jgi:DNA-binding transcriptional LysR family regulator
MHERELRAFVAVVEAGRMDHAARTLGYSQPAVSYQINCLEEELGTRLFLRRPDGAQLTRDGATMLPAARAVLTLLDGIKEVAAHGTGTETGSRPDR